MKFNKLLSVLTFLIIISVCGIITFLNRDTVDNDISAIVQEANINFAPNITRTLSKPSQIKHVFVIVEENHNWSTIYKSDDAPFINKTLLLDGAYASNYHNIPVAQGELHPSELNYITLEAGKITFPDHTFKSDNAPNVNNSTASTKHLSRLLEQKGYTWKSYQEDIPGNDCPIVGVKKYAPKHNPFIYFHDVSGNPPSKKNQYCIEHIRPLSELKHDLDTGNVPNYVFITPNKQNDMHDGTIAQADTWLSQLVPQITNSTTFKKDGALFITWDEGTEQQNAEGKDTNENNNPIGMIILSPYVKKHYTNTIAHSHASFLKTVQEIFGLTPLLGYANDPQTRDLFDFFNLAK